MAGFRFAKGLKGVAIILSPALLGGDLLLWHMFCEEEGEIEARIQYCGTKPTEIRLEKAVKSQEK